MISNFAHSSLHRGADCVNEGMISGTVDTDDDLSNYSLVYLPAMDFVGTDEFSINLEAPDDCSVCSCR